MASLNDRLDDLWRKAMKSDHRPVEIHIDRISHKELLHDPMSTNRDLFYEDGKWKWRNVPFVLVDQGLKKINFDAKPSDPTPKPPLIMTVVATNSVGRFAYFNDPENPKEFS